MNINEIINGSFEEIFFRILEKVLEHPIGGSMFSANAEDIGLDSISFVKLIVALEDEFDLELDNLMIDQENITNVHEFMEKAKILVENNNYEQS